MSGHKEVHSDPIFLQFPTGKSDGDKRRWPTHKLDQNPDAYNEVNFMRPIAHDEPLCIKWRTQIGREVAKLMGRTNHEKCVLKDFPAGYKFYHHNKGSVDDPRTDPYLYGSASGRYRSPQEFIPHAIWLMTDETLNRKNCGCKYCASSRSQKQISQDLGLRGTGAIPSFNLKPVKPKIRPVVRPRKPPPRNIISHDRTADLRSSRRFRAGELVWCALFPAIQGTESGECIKFWPGLVNETRLKNDVMPHAPGEQWHVVQSNVYKVKLLAVMHSCVLSETAIVPYQAYCPSVNLIEPLRRIGNPALLQDLQQLSKFNPIFMGDELTGISQLRFVEASTPFALAIQIAAHIVRLWTPSDEWTFHGEFSISSLVPQPGNGSTPVSVTETRYQGLWWGAERMWVDELVRLQPGRAQIVPQGSETIYRASPRADGRGALMRINAIFAETKGVSKDSVRECKIAGILYELAEETYEESPLDFTLPAAQDETASTTPPIPITSNETTPSTETLLMPDNGTEPSSSFTPTSQNPSMQPPSFPSPINIPSFPVYSLPQPPPGFKFRQITKPGYEIILDVSLIAGRYYPDLLKHPLLQDVLADVDMTESRVNQLSALCGLLAGTINSMECVDWVGTRLAMIKMADEKAQQDLHRHWHTEESMDIPVEYTEH